MTAGTPYLSAGLRAAFRAGLLAAALFAPSGAGWTAGWLYLGAYCAWSAANIALLGARRPGLLRLREAEPPSAAESWDKVFVLLAPSLALLGVIVCGIEGPSAPFSAVAAAALCAALGGACLYTWALLSNPSAAGTVVLRQGQTVADGGPYRAVRHPLYLASILTVMCTPAALCAPGAFPPAGLLALVIVARTALEDRLLLRSLPGYAEYAGRVPYRLLPGIW